jgi:hypothetical protein
MSTNAEISAAWSVGLAIDFFLFCSPSLHRSNRAANPFDISGTPVSHRRRRLNNRIPR